MKTFNQIIAEANNAMELFKTLKNELIDYSYKSGKSAKELKKDSLFIEKSKKMTEAKNLWYDLNQIALNKARTEKKLSILN